MVVPSSQVYKELDGLAYNKCLQVCKEDPNCLAFTHIMHVIGKPTILECKLSSSSTLVEHDYDNEEELEISSAQVITQYQMCFDDPLWYDGFDTIGDGPDTSRMEQINDVVVTNIDVSLPNVLPSQMVPTDMSLHHYEEKVGLCERFCKEDTQCVAYSVIEYDSGGGDLPSDKVSNFHLSYTKDYVAYSDAADGSKSTTYVETPAHKYVQKCKPGSLFINNLWTDDTQVITGRSPDWTEFKWPASVGVQHALHGEIDGGGLNMTEFENLDPEYSILTPVNTISVDGTNHGPEGKTNWYKFTTSGETDDPNHVLKIATCTPETTFETSITILKESHGYGQASYHTTPINRWTENGKYKCSSGLGVKLTKSFEPNTTYIVGVSAESDIIPGKRDDALKKHYKLKIKRI